MDTTQPLLEIWTKEIKYNINQNANQNTNSKKKRKKTLNLIPSPSHSFILLSKEDKNQTNQQKINFNRIW